MSPPTNPAPLTQLEDADILQRIADGDGDSLAELYDRFAPLLLTITRRILFVPSDAEEVVQEVFLQVWKQADRYRHGRSAVSTWLVMLARSRAIDRLRNRQSRDRTVTALLEEKPPTYTSSAAPANVLLQERRLRLGQELEALPTEQRQVIEMAFYEGLSQSEIAETAGIPLGTVKTRTLLAMKKLRKALGNEIRDLV